MDDLINEKLIEGVMEGTERERQALHLLLGKQREKDGHVLALQCRMGETTSYVTTVDLSWVVRHVHFAGDLPIFKGKVDEKTKKVPVDENTIDEIQQRQPDWRRQLPMAFYLATRRNHKFPPLLVVGYQEWVYEERAEQWGPDQRAMHNSLTITSLEPKGQYCDLDVKETNFYALDGQHRLMAIHGLQELLTKGRLSALDNNGLPKGKRHISRDQVIQYIREESGEDENAIHARLEMLMTERIGIEIIPAVSVGENYREALFRLRRTFVDVNENAKRLTRGELAQLDENQGFRVVARNAMVSHDLLRGRVNQRQGQLAETSPDYTTLDTLVEVASEYLGQEGKFQRWKVPVGGFRDLGYIRPNEKELAAAKVALNGYFDSLLLLPSHRRFNQGKEAGDIRSEEGEDNILFRPLAQGALAIAVAFLEERGVQRKDIMAELARQEDRGQLRLRDANAPWFGVLCTPDGTMRRQKGYRTLCARLLSYLLGGGVKEDEVREELRSDFAKARSADGIDSVNAEGDRVPIGEVQLPSPWR